MPRGCRHARRVALRVLTPLTLLCVASPPAYGQYAGTDVALASRYVWRGVTRVNHPVIQPQGFLGFRTGGAFSTAGIWADYEPWEAGTRDLSDRGFDDRGFGELNVWVEHSRVIEGMDVTVGATRYFYPGDAPGAGRTSAANTTELYGSLQWRPSYLSPKLAAWWDVDRVKGWYFEGSVSVPIMAAPQVRPSQPFVGLFLGALTGLSAGQGIDAGDPSELANFQDDGFTHLDLSASVNIRIPPFLHTFFTWHNQLNFDAATKRRSRRPGDTRRGFKAWVTFAFSWGTPW